MRNFFIILNSTLIIVLFFLSNLYSLPLTRTCYTAPDDKIDLTFKEEFIHIDSMNRKDNFSLNMGISNKTSIGFDFSFIHSKFHEINSGEFDDIFFNFWHFLGDFYNDSISAGFGMVIRIPTGRDAYIDEKYRNLSFGNDEFKIIAAISNKITNKDRMIFNVSYTFRAAKGEDFYSGFNLNPIKLDTYKSFFGLNPFIEGSFLEGERLKNDYAAIAAGFITSRLYPWIFFSEIYYSSRIYQGKDGIEGINIEGDNVNPLLLSLGMKYFFSDSFYLEFAGILDLLMNDGYIKRRSEFSINIFF
ncbi:MAG: hypothetical protein FWH53_09935 [Leptospirales bacterium]|nr:hypothetical protein [Leptospirales bacterium]